MIHDRALSKAIEIEEELRRLGWWDIPDPEPSAFDSEKAFFMDTMTFPQWLKSVLLPTVHRIVTEDGEFPSSSSVATQAIRELDGSPEAERLLSLLAEFDALFDAAPAAEGGP